MRFFSVYEWSTKYRRCDWSLLGSETYDVVLRVKVFWPGVAMVQVDEATKAMVEHRCAVVGGPS